MLYIHKLATELTVLILLFVSMVQSPYKAVLLDKRNKKSNGYTLGNDHTLPSTLLLN